MWPDSVAASGMSSPLVVRVINGLCNFTYGRAAAIVCQSDGMVKSLKQRGVPASKIRRIYNWSNYVSADNDDSDATFPKVFEATFAGHFNLVYGGNIGQAQSLGTLVEAAAKAARSTANLRLHLVGSGIDREKIVAAIADYAPNGEVILHNPIPPREMDRVFDQADALVMHLKDDPLYDITIPSKAQHYLSVGKPIVAGASGEVARMLASSGAARVVPPDNVDDMANAMIAAAQDDDRERKAAGGRGLTYYETHLGFEAAVSTTLDLIFHIRSSN